jgi:hypothetical protein
MGKGDMTKKLLTFLPLLGYADQSKGKRATRDGRAFDSKCYAASECDSLECSVC